ncbi:MAG TPA: phosphatidylglycerophosphatase A [Pseudomonadales bacterium]|nr:phosphatidylglycerophosphatase A [Pseudomonadales bacterium]
MTPRIPLAALRDPVILLATGFGAGLLRPAPGTWGTLVGIPLAWVLSLLTLPIAAALLASLAILGIGLCGAAGRRLGVSDHGGIVWDEIVGLCVALLLLPFDAVTVVLAFLTFRLFDIVKPWPISWADRSLPGGVGVMVDDLIAGVFAGLATYGLREALSRSDLAGFL